MSREESERVVYLAYGSNMAPARIEAIAREQLGMVYPDREHTVILEPHEASTLLERLPRPSE